MAANRYLQYQKPMAALLTALAPLAVMGIYLFGWRVAVSLAVCLAVSYGTEWLFLRKAGKPVTLAALVTGTLLALVLPPNVPFWIAALGAIVSITFGKMVFGGFGKNVFNPALVGRCFLYIAFPLYLTSGWIAPAPGPAGGFVLWTLAPDSAPADEVSAVTGATTLTAVKKLNQNASSAATARTATPAAQAQYTDAVEAIASVDLLHLFLGRESGCQGETSSLLILLGFAYLLYRRAVIWQLTVSPLLGIAATTLLLSLAGALHASYWHALAINLFGGGTLFACAFMTTEPVTAPRHPAARWIYGILIGVLGTVIRVFSVFNAGLMFAILLGNMFGPVIELACESVSGWRKNRSAPPAAAKEETP